MRKWLSLAATREWFLRRSFGAAGLRSATTDLGDGTVMHCWLPKSHVASKPSLVLIHGFGANAMWQWNAFVAPLSANFNLYVPDLVFFGGSRTTRPERSEAFQAQCVAALMSALGVGRAHMAGISYGGFVAYSLAAQFEERVEKVVLCCTGVCMEESDVARGMFRVGSVEDAISVLLPQTPAKARELIALSFHKPSTRIPTFFLTDFIRFMGNDYLEEKTQLIRELHRDRKMSRLPKISQPTLIIWGEYDVVFPMELAHRLKRHIDENSEVVVIKEAGHAINVEKPNEMCNHLNSFLLPGAHVV